MRTTDLFLIDGKPIVPPNMDMAISCEDLDSADSGRDQQGFMHRIVIRHAVKTWNFEYACISNEAYNYMESLFAGKSEFDFTYPSREDPTVMETTRAYRSKYGIVWHSSRTNDYRNYKFNIIEC